MLGRVKLAGAKLSVKRTALPPGSTCGQRWEISPAASSVSVVTAPVEDTSDNPLRGSSAATMLPSSLQLAPRPDGASHRMTGALPSNRVFFSLLPAKKPTHCPSVEKKGAYAPSVPGNADDSD